MKSYLAVFIAAVTVNCLVTTINGTPVTNTLTIPYTDMLLPPLEDVQDNKNDVASTSLQQNNTTTASISTTTSTRTKPTTTTTQKPLTVGVNNGLPELSIEALLPPLFDAKIEEEGKDDKTQQTKNKITTTRKPTAKVTTTATSTTRKPTTVKPTTTKVEVPDLFLDALLPPILDNTVDNTLNIKGAETTNTKTTTTKKPLLNVALFKTTKKSYYQQQTEHLKDLHLIDQDETHPKTYEKQQQQLKNLQLTTSETKNYNKLKIYNQATSPAKPVAESKPSETKNYNKRKNSSQTTSTATLKNDKLVAESKTVTQQVTKPSQPHLHRNIEKLTTQRIGAQVIQQKQKISRNNYDNNDPRQFNYSFDFYLGSTTARPPNSGLPTITPFPHRLGR